MSDIPASDWSAPWHSPAVPEHQGSQARLDMDAWRRGTPHANFDALRWLIAPIDVERMSFLEIGSGSGYLSAAVNWIQPQWEYTGVELSKAMIDYAYKNWPAYYVMGDAQKLPFDDQQFGFVMLATVIQHVADWRKAIEEAVRVSSRYVMLHRVECTSGATREFINPAYGQQLPTREINEQELFGFCQLNMELKFVNRVAWGRIDQWNTSVLWSKE